MRTAIVFLLVGIGTIVFHFWSPWWWTPIASNWGVFDLTILITFVITGAVFAVFMVFLAYCIYRYRHRPGAKAEYEPESPKLEMILTVGTAVGVIALLTPGLFAWADFVTVPDDAVEVEDLGQQWSWAYRYPGADGKLGTSSIANMSGSNPFGLNPDDPNGQDDLLIASSELHVEIGQPIKFLLRSKDVLHDFYVPQFRAKMDMVPGMVTFFWLEPTKIGKYEVICAELCGINHYAMRGHVVVESTEDFQVWLAAQPTFADTASGAGTSSGDPLVDLGRELAQSSGCLSCHSLDGSTSVGPTWQGLFGKTETLDGGDTALVDDAYLIESIADPNAKIVEGFAGIMPAYEFTDEEFEALIAFIESGS